MNCGKMIHLGPCGNTWTSARAMVFFYENTAERGLLGVLKPPP